MIASRSSQVPTIPLLFVGIAALLLSCGGDENPGGPIGPVGPQGDDFVTLAVGTSGEVTYVEASGMPQIDCDPRVDWWANQIVLWHDFTGGSGPAGYERHLDIMFPLEDGVGTYTVHGDFVQAFYHDGTDYSASPALATSDGTVVVIRSDDRIEGSFSFTVVDQGGTTAIPITGRFGVSSGFALSCP